MVIYNKKYFVIEKYPITKQEFIELRKKYPIVVFSRHKIDEEFIIGLERGIYHYDGSNYNQMNCISDLIDYDLLENDEECCKVS